MTKDVKLTQGGADILISEALRYKYAGAGALDHTGGGQAVNYTKPGLITARRGRDEPQMWVICASRSTAARSPVVPMTPGGADRSIGMQRRAYCPPRRQAIGGARSSLSVLACRGCS